MQVGKTIADCRMHYKDAVVAGVVTTGQRLDPTVRGMDVKNTNLVGVSAFGTQFKTQTTGVSAFSIAFQGVSDTETLFKTPLNAVFDNYGPRRGPRLPSTRREGAGVLSRRTQGVFGAEFLGSERPEHL